MFDVMSLFHSYGQKALAAGRDVVGARVDKVDVLSTALIQFMQREVTDGRVNQAEAMIALSAAVTGYGKITGPQNALVGVLSNNESNRLLTEIVVMESPVGRA